MNADLCISLTDVQKRALFKIAVDLVKADKQIHSDEVRLLDRLQRMCGIDSGDLEFIHYISLQQALSALKMAPEGAKQAAIKVLDSIVGADNDIDSREKILLAAVRLCLESQSNEWCSVVSASDVEAECLSEQIVYLEQSFQSEANRVLNDQFDYLLLSKALEDVGLQLFYLPNVIKELKEPLLDATGAEVGLNILRRSMGFIVPVGDGKRLADLSHTLEKVDIKTFYKVVCSRYRLDIDRIPFGGFLMVKIEDSYLLEDDGRLIKSVEFLCIDISQDVKRRILHFVGLLKRRVNLISYQGYYRLLYDYLSSESKIISSIVIDQRGDLRLADLDNQLLRFESAPQAKSLYLLLLRYGRAGVSQECFEAALEYLTTVDVTEFVASGEFSVERFKEQLVEQNSDWAKLIYNLITIYERLSTKDSGKGSFLGYISKIILHRSALKNYVNTGFGEVYHLANAEQYYIKFDKTHKSYFVELSPALVFVDNLHGEAVPITQHEQWSRLIV